MMSIYGIICIIIVLACVVAGIVAIFAPEVNYYTGEDAEW